MCTHIYIYIYIYIQLRGAKAQVDVRRAVRACHGAARGSCEVSPNKGPGMRARVPVPEVTLTTLLLSLSPRSPKGVCRQTPLRRMVTSPDLLTFDLGLPCMSPRDCTETSLGPLYLLELLMPLSRLSRFMAPP